VASFDEVIPPGEVGHIDATLDTKKLRGSVGRGITVYTDDPHSPKVFLTVRAIVVGGVMVLPQEMIYLNSGARNQRSPMVLVRREASETGEIEIDDVTTSVPWLAATVEPLSEPRPAADGLPPGLRGDWLVTVRAESSAPYGRHRETLQFKTGLKRQSEISIPVVVTRQAPIRLSADRIAFPPESDASTDRQTVLLTVRRDLDLGAPRIQGSRQLAG